MYKSVRKPMVRGFRRGYLCGEREPCGFLTAGDLERGNGIERTKAKKQNSGCWIVGKKGSTSRTENTGTYLQYLGSSSAVVAEPRQALKLKLVFGRSAEN